MIEHPKSKRIKDMSFPERMYFVFNKLPRKSAISAADKVLRQMVREYKQMERFRKKFEKAQAKIK